jgi:predicted O-linked N-acetylglucosamine transferase (SPINDLY family)
MTAGAPVFASFNNFAKVSPETMDLWAAVLKAVQGSRMVIKAAGLSTEAARQHARDCFRARGIDPTRLELQAASTDHLPVYNRCDIALDTFPYSGTATTCEALWMGLPVVTLMGNLHVSRVSGSLLTTVGLSELATSSAAEFVDRAKQLAENPVYLANLRTGMRERLAKSPLLDARSFARNLEAEYRRVWKVWCASSP